MNDLSLHILDITQNSIRAKAKKVDIEIIYSIKHNSISIIIKDDGEGMDALQLEKVTSPFYTTRTTRKMGLGLPMFRQSAEQTGGNLIIESAKGVGTIVTAHFMANHLDCPVFGDIASTLSVLFSNNDGSEIYFSCNNATDNFELNTVELKQILETKELGQPKIASYIYLMIKEELKELLKDNYLKAV